MSQSNTREGAFPIVAGGDLRGFEGRLAKLADDEGQAVAKVPEDNGDLAFFVLVEGADTGALAAVEPLDANRNVRVRLSGDCAPGEVLVLEDTADESERGKVRALPAEAGSYRGILIAEEAGTDGQLVLARPAMIGVVEVPGP